MRHFFSLIPLLVLQVCAVQVTYSSETFSTMTIEPQRVAETRWFDGSVEAVNRSTVSAQTSARVIEINFDVDDFVETGDVIVRFDAAEPTALLAQAEGALAEAMATREGADREFTRFEKLYKNRTVSRAQFDAAKAAADAASARVVAAEAAVDRAREQLRYTEVKAPYSGLVVQRHVELGELANPGQPLMTGISLNELRVTTAVPQRLAAAIRAGGKATIVDDTGSAIESSQLTVYPVANEATHTVTVRALLPEATTSVFPGMLVRIGFDVGHVERLLIPLSALVQRGELTGVYRVTGEGELRLQQIRTGRTTHTNEVEVTSGLSAGDVIVSDALAATRHVDKATAQ